MTMKRTPRPRDPIQLGKLMVDIATGHVPDAVDDGAMADKKRAAGTKGGSARANALTPQQRSEAASLAANARWKKG